MLKLVLLDPHPVVQKGFKTFFENNDSIIVCDTFTSIDALFEFLSENELDVVIMEMELPDGSAVNTIKKIKKNYPNISILIYTSLPQTIYGISLLKAGALGYCQSK